MQLNVISSTDIGRGLVDGILAIYKHAGETPLESLGRLRMRFPVLQNVPLSYAGRLDPLASGLMLVLSGSYNKMRGGYMGLDKEYEVKILFGVSTDTGDVMGMFDIDSVDASTSNNIHLQDEETLKRFVTGLKGLINVPYPVYSSKTVGGKALHQWANEGRLDEIDIPTRTSEIYSAELLSVTSISGTEAARRAIDEISYVKGDFRQAEISAKWDGFSARYGSSKFMEITVRVSASSGTYMRSLAERLGESFGTRALASSIIRNKVGNVDISEAIIIT